MIFTNQEVTSMWYKYVFQKKRRDHTGYTLPEVMAAVVIIGVLAAMAGPAKSWFENPLANGTNQTVGMLNLVRMRAISTTSAYRIKPDSSDPTKKFKIEIAQTRGCESSTKLTADATATDTELDVASTTGLVVGDSIKVGTDSSNNPIIATDASTITLGQPLGTAQAEDQSVELMNNWFNDKNFDEEDLTLPEDIELSGTPTDWTLCFNSRGLASLYNAYGVVNSNLTLTLTNTLRGEQSQITILQGGSIEVED